jgi:outer membrane protein TolC
MLAFLAAVVAHGWANPDAALNADDVVRQALLRHPDLVAARGDVAAATGRREQLSVFIENPEISVGVAVAGGLVQGTVNQPLSITGEGWHARRWASAGFDAVDADARRVALRVAAEARVVYARAITTRERWELSAEALADATTLRTAVEARAAVGEARELDVRMARMAEAEAAQLAIDARREHAAALAALSTWAPSASGALLAEDPRAAVPIGAGAGRRSDLVAAEARVRAAEAGLARERAAAMPLVGVGMFFQVDKMHGDPGDIGPQVMLGVPLWDRNQAAVASARADVDARRADLAAVGARVDAERVLYPEVAAYAEATLEALGDLETEARAALASIQLGWTTGELSIADAVMMRREVLTAWVAAVDARQSAVEARIDALFAEEDPSLIPADVAVAEAR